MKKPLTMLLALLAVGGILYGCSGEKSKTEKVADKIDKFTSKTADKAVKKIRTPLDKARRARDLGGQRLKDIDKAMSR